jgi:hypothetical protein
MNRDHFTVKLIALLPDSKKISFDQARIDWWFNPSKTGGFRLTPEGFKILGTVLEIEHWRVAAHPNLRLLLDLEKKLETPYFLDVKKRELVLFGSKDAMMATLHGDVKRWLELLQNRNN